MTVAVAFLMIAGTGYDVYVTRKYTRRKNVVYDLERRAKLEMANGNQKPLSAFQGTVYLPVPAAEVIVNGPQPLAVNNNNDHEGSLRSASPEVHKFGKLLASHPLSS